MTKAQGLLQSEKCRVYLTESEEKSFPSPDDSQKSTVERVLHDVSYKSQHQDDSSTENMTSRHQEPEADQLDTRQTNTNEICPGKKNSLPQVTFT